MNTRLTILLVVAAIAAAALAAGCGDDGDDTGTAATTSPAANGATGSGEGSNSGESSAETGEQESSAEAGEQASPDKAQFVNTANRICRQAAQRILAFPTEAQAISQGLVAQFKAVATKIEAETAPEGDEAEVEAFVEALRADVAGIERDEPATFEQAEELLQPSSRLADEYGISGCSFG